MKVTLLLPKWTVVIVSALVVLNSGACSSVTGKGSARVIAVQMPDPNRIRFSGKGAGAGMMLSSSMGPMGIAIGVAIDEGIAKDIQKRFNSGGRIFDDLLRTEMQKRWPAEKILVIGKQDTTDDTPAVYRHIVINHYGFKLVPDGEDLVVPYIDGTVMCRSGSSEPTVLPKFDNALGMSAALAQVKADNDLSYELFEQYLSLMLKALCQE